MLTFEQLACIFGACILIALAATMQLWAQIAFILWDRHQKRKSERR
jgi:hypothetical protein